MLELRNMTKMIGDKWILRNVTLSLGSGETLAVIGPNGAGKSTFFKCTVGLLQPTSGEIILEGEKVGKKSAAVKKKIGFLGHESFLYANMTPLENLRFYGKLYKVKDIEEKSERLLRQVGLYLFRETPIRSFSRGMLQRLAIAKVLLPNPKILMLDEPHTGLDQEAIMLLNEIIMERQKAGTSILMISHDFEQVAALADRAAILNKGKIVDTFELSKQVGIREVKTRYEKAVHPE